MSRAQHPQFSLRHTLKSVSIYSSFSHIQYPSDIHSPIGCIKHHGLKIGQILYPGCLMSFVPKLFHFKRSGFIRFHQSSLCSISNAQNLSNDHSPNYCICKVFRIHHSFGLQSPAYVWCLQFSLLCTIFVQSSQYSIHPASIVQFVVQSI